MLGFQVAVEMIEYTTVLNMEFAISENSAYVAILVLQPIKIFLHQQLNGIMRWYFDPSDVMMMGVFSV